MGTKKILFLTLIFGAVLFFGGIDNARSANCDTGFYKCSEGALGPVCDPIPSECDRLSTTGACQSTETPGSIICSGAVRCCNLNESDVCSGEPNGTLCEDTDNAITGTCQDGICEPDVCSGESNGTPCENEDAGITGTCQDGYCVAGGGGGKTCPTTATCKADCSISSGESELTGPFTNCNQKCCTSSPPPPPGGTCPSGFKKEAGGVCFPTGTGLSEKTIAEILRNLLLWIIYVFGFIAIGAFVISGIQYLVSAGDEDTINTAKRNMKWSLVGVIVALSAFVIIKAITAALQATTLF